jgi:hypothetical protein
MEEGVRNESQRKLMHMRREEREKGNEEGESSWIMWIILFFPVKNPGQQIKKTFTISVISVDSDSNLRLDPSVWTCFLSAISIIMYCVSRQSYYFVRG